ncbi:hypothetical protein GZL_03715 [Streptomyces sp. 769]|nr:hypothetical protein GZL_03715 [Streptomyces sp. 769]
MWVLRVCTAEDVAVHRGPLSGVSGIFVEPEILDSRP